VRGVCHRDYHQRAAMVAWGLRVTGSRHTPVQCSGVEVWPPTLWEAEFLASFSYVTHEEEKENRRAYLHLCAHESDEATMMRFHCEHPDFVHAGIDGAWSFTSMIPSRTDKTSPSPTLASGQSLGFSPISATQRLHPTSCTSDPPSRPPSTEEGGHHATSPSTRPEMPTAKTMPSTRNA
jgi:hypothetical protein